MMGGLAIIGVFLVTLFILLFIGVPIAFTLLLVSGAILFYIGNYDSQLIAQAVVFGANSFTLLAIPFFVLAGEIMSYGGISKRIVDFVAALVGHVRGGLGYVVILASVIFAGLSGSAVADAAALGAILIPMMIQMGYDRATSVALVCASALIAPIIPPSVPLILFGVAAQTSIGRLFMASIVPGLILAAALMIFWFFLAKKENYPVGKKATKAELWQAFKRSIFALVMPVIIVGGIRFGIFTPTEAGCIACVYALFISICVYRELSIKDTLKVFVSTSKTTGQVLLVAATAMSTAWVVTTAGLPQDVAIALHSFTATPMLLVFIIAVFLVFLGMVMDSTPAILIFAPIFMPLIKSAGIDPVYFGIIMVLDLMVGLITPPVGTVLFVGCGVGNVPFNDLVKKIWPFILVEFAVLFLYIFVPQLVTVPMKWFI
jgi:tripartite ATP-independent transporter DctM subunit